MLNILCKRASADQARKKKRSFARSYLLPRQRRRAASEYTLNSLG